MVRCPICNEDTTQAMINYHLDRGCKRKRLGGASAGLGASAGTGASVGAGTGASVGTGESSIPSTMQSLASSPPAVAASTPRGSGRPLAEVMRPRTLDEYYGQQHLVGPDGVLRGLLERDVVPSILLWGPPGVGKTSFARLVSSTTRSRFVELSATKCGTAEVKQVVEEARKHWALLRQPTILFLDEIHRFNRGQQDTLLPCVERGDITLIGATTENPSFKLQAALLSRCQVFMLEKLGAGDLKQMLTAAQASAGYLEVKEEVLDHIAEHAQGDGRVALNMLEIAASLGRRPPAEIKAALRTLASYDQRGENHYDFISAFHKSVRGSDADATLYYLARMLEGGEDPLYISRRMVRMASEDIGLADESCLPFAVATHTSVQQLGLPECDVVLAHCAVKLARAAKDVEVYKAWGLLKQEVAGDQALRNAPIPMHLRNAPTKLMEEMGYANGYKYNPSYVSPVEQRYLPAEVNTFWLGRWQPDKCDFCVGECEHLGVARADCE